MSEQDDGIELAFIPAPEEDTLSISKEKALAMFPEIFTKTLASRVYFTVRFVYGRAENERCAEWAKQLLEDTALVDAYVKAEVGGPKLILDALIAKGLTEPVELPETVVDMISRLDPAQKHMAKWHKEEAAE